MNFRKIKRNFSRNTKAISPVIATLLITIAVAVVASLVAYAFVMGYMGSTQRIRLAKLYRSKVLKSKVGNHSSTSITSVLGDCTT